MPDGRTEGKQRGAKKDASAAGMAPNPRFYGKKQGALGREQKTEINLQQMPGAKIP